MQAKLMVDADAMLSLTGDWNEEANALAAAARMEGQPVVLTARLAAALAMRECADELRRRVATEQELATPHRQGE